MSSPSAYRSSHLKTASQAVRAQRTGEDANRPGQIRSTARPPQKTTSPLPPPPLWPPRPPRSTHSGASITNTTSKHRSNQASASPSPGTLKSVDILADSSSRTAALTSKLLTTTKSVRQGYTHPASLANASSDFKRSKPRSSSSTAGVRCLTSASALARKFTGSRW